MASGTSLQLTRISEIYSLPIYSMVGTNIGISIDFDFVGSVTILKTSQWSFSMSAVNNLASHNFAVLTEVVDHPIIPSVGVQALDG
jgi:hypothetical protein